MFRRSVQAENGKKEPKRRPKEPDVRPPHPDTEGSSIGSGATVESRAFAPLNFDPGRYDHFVASFELTEREKSALLAAVWSLASSFVDIGFQCHPAQHAIDVGNARLSLADDSDAMLACKDTFNERSNKKTPRLRRRRSRRKES